MRTVIFEIRTLESTLAGFSNAWKTGRGDASAHIGFESWEAMHKVLSPKRLEIIRSMVGAGPVNIREIARRVDRDFKGVHSDVRLLEKSGVINEDETGRMIFPYDRIHVEFEIDAAA